MADPASSSKPANGEESNNQPIEGKVVEGLKDLKLETKPQSLVVNGSSSSTERSSKVSNSQTPSDDNSQRADSNSELGTKPPSLDGKSITSGTTFALDEKESLRPDDSASVKAAAEDDDAFSIRGSYMASSRMGSEVAARIHRLQIGDMPLRTGTTHILAGNQGQGAATPQSGISEKQAVTDLKMPLASVTPAPDSLTANGFLSQNPDEKLLEAMRSEKDRFTLLKLEQQVIEFVENSKEPFMDLPPNNSFWRMLTHKLADYYHMTHSFEAVAGAVRIYRTPFCRIPASLSSIAASTPSSNSPAPVVTPFKIMRRGEDGEFAANSTSPSKATSEVGSDGKDKAAPAREKLTREEREEAYNRARQRIFGSVEKTDATPDGEDSNGISRASSVSAKDKANGNKRKPTKQRRDDSESFDSRSNYVAWCGPQQSTWAPAPQYFPVNSIPFNGQYQQPYPNTIPPPYGPNQAYAQVVPGNAFASQYNGMPTYPTPPLPQPATAPAPAPVPAPIQQQRFQPPNPPISAPYTPPVPHVAPVASGPQPAWSQPTNFNQNAYPPTRGSPPQPGIPYAYGQLPANANPNDPKSQHPIPGSYNRQSFNPKTQSFVPGNGLLPMQPAAPGPYVGPGSHHGSPQFNHSHLNYGGYQQPLPPPQAGGYAPPPVAYGMARQGSNSSMGHYHAVQPPHGPQHMPPNPPMPHMPTNTKLGGPHAPSGPPGQTFSHLPNYGNPATLPQKPST